MIRCASHPLSLVPARFRCPSIFPARELYLRRSKLAPGRNILPNSAWQKSVGFLFLNPDKQRVGGAPPTPLGGMARFALCTNVQKCANRRFQDPQRKLFMCANMCIFVCKSEALRLQIPTPTPCIARVGSRKAFPPTASFFSLSPSFFVTFRALEGMRPPSLP